MVRQPFMAHATESLERAEHAGHAGHGGHGHAPEEGNPLPQRIGITMAILGVILAFAGARVGYERAELVQWLVDQQHAHSEYTAQNIKHRTAILSLQQLRAFADTTKLGSVDMVNIATAANRYLAESNAAKSWVESYDPMVEAHSLAQEEYEHGQLAAELGIVLASVALLLRRRLPWLLGVALGVVAVGMVAVTYLHTAHAVEHADGAITAAEHTYQALRESGKSGAADQAMVDDVLKTYGAAVKN
jgi:hypothetical protein